MINFFRRKLQGATTLVLATMLLISATLVVIFGAYFSIIQQRITSNLFRSAQAFEAAQAGIEFGTVYLQMNKSTITTSPVNGFIPYYTSASTSNVVLANGAKFSIVYTNPISGNYNLITITSTGISDDGTSTRVLSQQVQFGSILSAPGTTSIVGKGTFSMNGTTIVTNTSANNNIQTGGATFITGGSRTVTSSGTSSNALIQKSDVSSVNLGLSAMSSADFFTRFFGANSTLVANKFANTYSNSTTTNYNSLLNGVTGTTIWINQTAGTAQINGFTTIGTAANPVLLVVNGDLALSGNAIINGFVFVGTGASNTTTITGNAVINGTLVTSENLTTNNNAAITFNPAIDTILQNSLLTTYFAKVPGTWADW